MNDHTAGPLTFHHTGPIMRGYTQPFAVANGAQLVAGAFGDVAGGEDQAKANAYLLAASYTMVDKAARELGVEAVELAKLDLAQLIAALLDAEETLRVLYADGVIKAASNCNEMRRNDLTEALLDSTDRARAVLDKVGIKRL